MKKNNDDKKLALLCIGTFFIFAFFIIFSHKAKAEEPNFPMLQNENNTIPQSHIDIFNSYLDVDNNYYFIYKGQQFSDGVGYFYVYIPKSYENAGIYGEISNNGYQFSLYLIGSANLVNGRLDIADGGGIYNTVFYQPPFTNFTNINSSKYDTNISYVSNFKVFTNNTENADVVLKYGPDPIPPIDIGVAIVPPGAFVPDYPSGTTPPTQVPPSYTPTDYIWTTPPTFDSSSITNAIGSIQNTLGWLANNLKEEFKNITDNGKHFVEYIGKTIQYYGNAILQILNNFIQNFYDNMKSLVEPIYTKISEFADLFINPFDEEEFDEQIENCQLITEYNELLDNCEVLQQIFDETAEPDSFILYIDFENPFADSEHKIIHGEINFNWLVPLRPAYRPFLQVFVLIECFVGGFRILGNIIGGKAK